MSEIRERPGGQGYRLGEISCRECGAHAPLFAAGWLAFGLEKPYTDELPALAFSCPDCATPDADAE